MLGNWISETTATTGTGTITVDATAGRARFSDIFNSGELVSYTLLDSSGNPLEKGIGTVTYTGSRGSPSGAVTIARSIVQATLSGSVYNDLTPTAVSLTGTTTVICTPSESSYIPTLPAVNSALTGTDRAIIPDNVLSLSGSAASITSQNRIHYYPVLIGYEGLVDAFIVRLVGTSGNADIGLYTMGANGKPSKKIVSVDNVTITSGMAAYSFAARKIRAGWYFVAYNVAATATTIQGCTMKSISGYYTTFANPMNMIVENATQGSMPATATPLTPYYASGDFPMIALRAA